jgi:membrane fusion protein, multidrug efflux system
MPKSEWINRPAAATPFAPARPSVEHDADASSGTAAPHLAAAQSPSVRSSPADEQPDARVTQPANARQPAESAVGLAVAPDQAPRRTARSNWVRRTLFALLPVALIAGGYWYVAGGQVMSTEDAYVQADRVGVSTDVSGIVKEVDVTENQRVDAGQVLYRLDDEPFRYALDRADAQVGMVRDDLNALKANYRDMQAQITQAQNDIDYYGTEFQRQQDLSGKGFASQQTFDTARRNLQSAQQKLASLKQQQAAIVANLNGDPDLPVEQHPRYRDALAQRNEAARQLDHTVVKAPFAGIATNVPSIAPGKYLAASTTSFFLVATDHVWVDANPKETQLTYVRPGQPVAVTVDTYPDREWHGTVESISPAAAQEFQLLPAQNTSGNWVKVVQRIPMRVRVDTGDKSLPPLRVGMSVEVDVDTGHARGVPHVLKALLGWSDRGA